jgi:formate dehydrogenase major subunit
LARHRSRRLHLPVAINGDLALFQAFGKLLVEWDALDHDFIARYCRGFEAWRDHVAALEWSRVTEITGLSRAQISEAAELLRTRRPCSVGRWDSPAPQRGRDDQGDHQRRAAQGNIGKPGAGLFPVRGHSNVQGDRTMGIWERPPAHFLDRLQAEFGFDPPRQHGYDTVDAIRALRDGHAQVFICLGGNFVQAAPDTEVTAAALRRASLTVQVSTKINRSHLVCGRTALILPTRWVVPEQGHPGQRPQRVSVEDSACAVHASHGPLKPASAQLRSEVAIVTGLAEATLGIRHGIDWAGMRDDYRTIRRHIARVVPGCESYEVNVTKPGGFVPRTRRGLPYLPDAVGPGGVRGLATRGAGGATRAPGPADPAQP